MEQEDADLHDLLQAGIADAKAKRKVEARQLLKQVVARDPQSEEGWLWLAAVAPTAAESLDAFERVLTINPANQRAEIGRSLALSHLNNATDGSAPAGTPLGAAPPASPPTVESIAGTPQAEPVAAPPATPTPTLPDTVSTTFAPPQRPRTTAPLVMPEPPPSENGSLDEAAVAETELPATAEAPPVAGPDDNRPAPEAQPAPSVETLRPVGRRGSLVPLLLGALLLIVGALLAVTGLFGGGGSGYFDGAGTKFFQAQLAKNYTAAAGYLAPDLRQKYYAAQNDLPELKLNQALGALTSPAVLPGKPFALTPDGNQGEAIVTITSAPTPVSYLVRLTKSGSSWLITAVSPYPPAP